MERIWSKFIRVGVLVALVAALLPVLAVGSEASQAAPAGQDTGTSVKRDVTYCTASGVSLLMDLYLPAKKAEPAPTVLYVHGGSWISGDKYEIGGAGPALAARGYVVASLNYRLAPAYKWPAQIQDVKCAVRYLRANAAAYNIDVNRIAAWGSSAGGHLVAMLGLTTPAAGFDNSGGYANQSSRVQAVVDMFGPTDLLAYNPDDFSIGIAQAVFGVSPGQSTEVVQKASPVTYVSKDAPPFLVLHGDKDTVVPLSQSQELVQKLTSVGVSAQLVVVKNAGHAFAPVGGDISPSLDQISAIINNFLDATIGAQTQSQARSFPQTGQQVRGVFLQYWLAHGGLPQFGYPVTAERQERSDIDGKTYTMQYFERAVMELHPENAPPNNVLLSLLGSMAYKQKYPNGAPNQTPNTSPGSILFSQTGHRLGGRFLQYWQQNGGVAQQGYPISNEFKEVSAVDGKTYTVQYFERAVFEYHPENKAPYDVLLSPLGALRLKDKTQQAGR